MGVTGILQAIIYTLGGMVFARWWTALCLALVLCVCHISGYALDSEDELIRELLASRESQEPAYEPQPFPMMQKRRQQAFSSWAGKRGGPRSQAFSSWAGKRSNGWPGKRAPFSSWAGKRSGEAPIYHEMPEYVRHKRSSEESEEAQEAVEKRAARKYNTGINRFARDVRQPAAMRPVKGADGSDVVFRPQRATFSAWGGR